MALAISSTELRLRIEGHVRGIEDAADAKRLQAERRRQQAADRRMRTPLNFDKLLDRIENYMSGDLGPSRASGNIEKILQQMIERCGPATPFQIKGQSLETMITALDIIVGSSGSMARRTCVNDNYFWRVHLKQMWERLDPDEQRVFPDHW